MSNIKIPLLVTLSLWLVIRSNLAKRTKFDLDEFNAFRGEIIDEIKAEQTGLILGHPLVGPLSGLIPGM